MTYTPKPIDTADVQLDEELLNTTEIMAEHVHDLWAQERIASGWSYGPKRNDDAKEHPCLVPYPDLSEDEKAYDRNTALGAIMVMVKLGLIKA